MTGFILKKHVCDVGSGNNGECSTYAADDVSDVDETSIIRQNDAGRYISFVGGITKCELQEQHEDCCVFLFCHFLLIMK